MILDSKPDLSGKSVTNVIAASLTYRHSDDPIHLIKELISLGVDVNGGTPVCILHLMLYRYHCCHFPPFISQQQLTVFSLLRLLSPFSYLFTPIYRPLCFKR